MANRNLMPKSGAMAPYIVVNRDAAVAGVFSVDGQVGVIDLSTKYVLVTAYNQKIGSLEQRISTLESSMTLVNQSIDSLNTSVGNLNTAVGQKAAKGVNSDITEIKGLTTALSIDQGGTGGKTASQARSGLELERFQQPDTTTIMYAPISSGFRFQIHNNGVWGATKNNGADWHALGVAQGGTGAATAADARANLQVPGLADENTFTNRQVVRSQDGVQIQKTASNGNAWIGFNNYLASGIGVTKYRIGMLGGEVAAYMYDDAGTNGRRLYGYDYSANEFTFYQNVVMTTPFVAPNMELGIKQANVSSYVDFHYSGKYDYDARIICDGMNTDAVAGGNMRHIAGYIQLDGRSGGTNITGNRLRVNTSDAVFDTQVGLASGSIQVPGLASDTTPIGAGLRGIHAGTDSNAFDRASNINMYSWYGVAFCTAYTSPTNGIVSGKPAVLINTRDGNINTMGVVISKGVTLTSDIRKKDDVKPINGEESSEKLARLGTYTYHYKGGTTYTAGVIAQEVEKEFPELISENEADDNALQVDYMGLLGHMHAAFKTEREKRIDLEKRLAKMEAFLASKFDDF